MTLLGCLPVDSDCHWSDRCRVSIDARTTTISDNEKCDGKQQCQRCEDGKQLNTTFEPLIDQVATMIGKSGDFQVDGLIDLMQGAFTELA